jgi:hypothetical protein
MKTKNWLLKKRDCNGMAPKLTGTKVCVHINFAVCVCFSHSQWWRKWFRRAQSRRKV